MAVAATHRLSRDQVIWSFGPDLEPVLEIDPGDTVTFETNDCFTGQIQNESDLVTEIDFQRVNSATGPIAVRGAEPGDSAQRLGGAARRQPRQPPARPGRDRLPAGQPAWRARRDRRHARMGDGEVCFTGVEIAGEVTIRLDVLKGKQGTWPVTELADSWVVHGTAGPDFMEALHRAVEEGARFLVDEWGFTMEEAFVFLSVACDANICQACRPQEFSTIARVSIPKVSATPRPFS
jgi:acetamidase/formamidase